ncbi:MAG: carbohydrate-binding domain-containing protein [Oscillospiraceae bacterium]
MRTSFRMLAALCTAAATFMSGCNNGSEQSGSTGDTGGLMLNNPQSGCAITPERVNDSDSTPAKSADCKITFAEGKADIAGKGASADGAVVTISKAGVYSVSGSCSDGRIVIDADKSDEVSLILNGLSLTSKSGSAIYCDNAGKFTLTLAQGTENTISDTANYNISAEEDEPDAAIFSREDTVINGSGSLTVNGGYLGAIKCKDGLKICDGSITVNSVDDGIKGKDYLIVAGGTINVSSGKDGLVSTNDKDETLGYVNITGGDITIAANNDGIQAQTELIVSGGSIIITAGEGSASVEHTEEGGSRGGFFGDRGKDFSQWEDTAGNNTESIKGLKAGSAVTISGGTITVDSADDSVHSNGSVTISGGTLELASGDDGIHAEAELFISAGDILITSSYEGLEGKCIEIEGGTINLTAFDDGLNAAGEGSGGFGDVDNDCYISISGGSLTVNASGDGIDSNGTIAMSGGVVVVFGPTNSGNGALDYGSSFALSGGTLAALGSAGMAAAPSTLSQPCLSIYSQVSAGSSIEVRDPDGNAIISVVTPKACESLILSASEMTVGTEYGIYADETLLASVVAENGVSGGGASGNGMGGFGNHGWDFGGGDRPTPPEGGFGGEKPEFPGGERPGDFERGDREEIVPPEGEQTQGQTA